MDEDYNFYSFEPENTFQYDYGSGCGNEMGCALGNGSGFGSSYEETDIG